MANSYPTSLNNYTGNETLSAAGHAQAHNAYEAKIGTGASTPISGTVLKGTGTGTSGWAGIDLTTDVTGTLPVSNGGTGRATLTSGSVLVGNGTGTVSLYTTTGSGTVLALATSPTLVTPTLGVASATSINKVAITTPASSATLTIANGKTLTASNTLTFTGTDSTSFAFPSSSDTVVTLTASQTLTSKTLTTPTITSPTLQGNIDGWILATDTWTYASATSFTISGVDRAAIYRPGTLIKMTNNSSTKYFIVASSAFSTNTTVTLMATSDYSINNSAITNPYYSYQPNPQGFPSGFNFTPTFGGFSADPTMQIVRYSTSGRTIFYMGVASGNGTSNNATTTVTAPVAAAQTFKTFGLGRATDNGSSQTSPPTFSFTQSSATITVLKDISENAFTSSGSKSFNWQIYYEF